MSLSVVRLDAEVITDPTAWAEGLMDDITRAEVSAWDIVLQLAREWDTGMCVGQYPRTTALSPRPRCRSGSTDVLVPGAGVAPGRIFERTEFHRTIEEHGPICPQANADRLGLTRASVANMVGSWSRTVPSSESSRVRARGRDERRSDQGGRWAGARCSGNTRRSTRRELSPAGGSGTTTSTSPPTPASTRAMAPSRGSSRATSSTPRTSASTAPSSPTRWSWLTTSSRA